MPTPGSPLDAYLQPGPTASLLGRTLRFRTVPGLFSPDRVDDGTRLLLDHLPNGAPEHVLDIGCGYGALGLPIAAKYPGARVCCVDRDAVAAAVCGMNAAGNGLTNVETRPSVGHTNAPTGPWDWVLCNVPARIGEQGIRALVEAGFPRLRPGGEVRVVVINDLRGPLASLADRYRWDAAEVAVGTRHAIWRFRPGAAGGHDEHAPDYTLDTVTIDTPGGPITIQRHHDASEDPSHLHDGLPLLLECLPTKPPVQSVVWRGGAGAAAIALGRRGSCVIALDRDLLALDYVRRNGQRAGVSINIEPVLTAASGLRQFDPDCPLVVGESTASYPPSLARREADDVLAVLPRSGTALWLVSERASRGWTAPAGAWTRIAARGRWAVLRGRGNRPAG